MRQFLSHLYFFLVLVYNLPRCCCCSQSVSNSWQTVANHVKSTLYTVRGLRPNTIYLFMVRAINPQGLSDPSPMSDPVRTQGKGRSEFHVLGLKWREGTEGSPIGQSGDLASARAMMES